MTAGNVFSLEIVTPDRSFFSGEVTAIVLPAYGGELEVLRYTLPMAVVLDGGVMRIEQNGRWMEAVVGSGFVRVDRDKTTVMAESAEWPYEINADRVQEEIGEIDEKLRRAQSMREYRMAKAQLAIQLAKLKIKDYKD